MKDWLTTSVVITHDVGLHARPSVRLTKLAKGFSAAIEVARAPSGPWFDAKSIVKVMAIRAGQGTTLYLRAHGTDSVAAISALSDLVAGAFDEDTAGVQSN
jgi:phosphocarrier protein HPr